jgi:hypothetical protein
MGISRTITFLVAAACACLLAGCGHSEGRTADASSLDDVEEATDPVEEEGPRECTHEEMLALEEEVMRLAPEGDPCFSGSVIVSNDGVEAHVNHSWWSLCLYCGPDGYGERLDGQEGRVEEAVYELIPECAIPWDSRVVCVGGGSIADYYRIVEAAEEACGHLWSPTHDWGTPLHGAEFHLDDDGVVTDVVDDEWGDPMTPEELECIGTSLEGLTLPCLAGFDICPGLCLPGP